MPNLQPSYALNYNYLFNRYFSNRIFNNYQPKIVSNRRYEEIEISSDNLIFRLRDKSQKDFISVLALQKEEYHQKTFYEVKLTWSRIPGRHFLSYLFDLVVFEFNYSLLSDSNHTSPGSKEFWISLGRKKKYTLEIFNTITGYFRNYSNYPLTQIWGIETDIIDNEIKMIFIEDSFNRHVISKEIRDFFFEKIEDIMDRSNIRLYLKH